jgi:hypothetical protein
MNERNEGEEKKTFNLIIQGISILFAKLSSPKSNHKIKTLNIVID